MRERPEKNMQRLDTLFSNELNHLERASGTEPGTSDVITGFEDLDGVLSGLSNSSLTVLASRPCMGKTTLAINIAYHAAAKQGAPTCYISGRTSPHQFAINLASLHARRQRPRLKDVQTASVLLRDALYQDSILREIPLFFDYTPGVNLLELKHLVHEFHKKGCLRFLIVDDIDLIRGQCAPHETQNSLSVSLKFLRDLACLYEVPVLVTHKIPVEPLERSETRPRLNDLYDTSYIERYADTILLLYRDEVYNPNSPEKGTAEVSVAKSKYGFIVGHIRLIFRSQYYRFENYIHDFDEA